MADVGYCSYPYCQRDTCPLMGLDAAQRRGLLHVRSTVLRGALTVGMDGARESRRAGPGPLLTGPAAR